MIKLTVAFRNAANEPKTPEIAWPAECLLTWRSTYAPLWSCVTVSRPWKYESSGTPLWESHTSTTSCKKDCAQRNQPLRNYQNI